MSVAQPDFAQPGELEVELWDGEEVVRASRPLVTTTSMAADKEPWS